MVNRLFLGIFCRLVGFSDDYEGAFHVGVCQLEFFGFFQVAAEDFDGGFGSGQFILDFFLIYTG